MKTVLLVIKTYFIVAIFWHENSKTTFFADFLTLPRSEEKTQGLIIIREMVNGLQVHTKEPY